MRYLRLYSASRGAGLIACCFLSTTNSQPSTTNSPKPSVVMETSIVSQAMVLVRQRKFEEARGLLLPAAERGESEPQALLGQIYNAGWGVPVDYELAFKWWSRAAEGGSTDAQWGLGLLYDDGKGVTKDSKKAALLWKKAADRGNIKATIHLAFLYEEGRGVERDLKECTRLFGIAAKAGEPGAQLNYGLKLLYGIGVEQNKSLGCAWLEVAAESTRVRGASGETIYDQKIRSARDSAWRDLSSDDRKKAEKLKIEILSHIQTD
jgi:TPR repeat protein